MLNALQKRMNVSAFAPGLALTGLVLVSAGNARAQAREGFPTVTGYTLISGTSDMYMPGASFANFEAGDLVVGSTHWDNDGDGIVFLGAFEGFLWNPTDGARVFEIDESLYWTSHFQTPSAIADNSTVVGTFVYREELRNVPFVWTPAAGFNFLPCAAKGGTLCMGFTTAVTPSGDAAVGSVSRNVIPGAPTRAARWSISEKGRFRTTLKELETSDAWSNAWDVSSDGEFIVGDSGPEEALPVAARWFRERRQQVEAVGSASSALFTSRDGTAALGWAMIGDRKVLVRWDHVGAALVAEPPDGTTLESIRAVSPAATSAVGSLSRDGNWAPFLWTLDAGFTVIPENGMEQDYDRSEAWDVSDDGTSVVGYLGASVVSNGYPPTRGFLWRPSTGLILMNDLMSAAGFPNPDFYFVDAISGDGLRLLTTGNAAVTVHDTNSLLVNLAYP